MEKGFPIPFSRNVLLQALPRKGLKIPSPHQRLLALALPAPSQPLPTKTSPFHRNILETLRLQVTSLAYTPHRRSYYEPSTLPQHLPSRHQRADRLHAKSHPRLRFFNES
jgi:hypothetical protein